MKRSKSCVAIVSLFAVLFFSVHAAATGIVIVHPSNASTINAKQIAKIFLGKQKSFPGGEKALPLNQSEGSAVRSDFASAVLNKNDEQVKAYWTKRVFTGKGTPPKEVIDDATVIAMVADNPSYIGYVSDSANLDDNVRVLYSF